MHAEYEAAFFYNDPSYLAWLVDGIAPLLEASSPPRTAPCLVDLGGGTGNFTQALAARLDPTTACRRALCVDNSADMLQQVCSVAPLAVTKMRSHRH